MTGVQTCALPISRTAWHSHGLGQTLYIVEGIALVQSRGGEIIEAYPGPQTVTEGTDAIVGLATEGPGHRSGRFVDRDGEIKWS